MSMLELISWYIIFFLMGLTLEYAYAKWTFHIAKLEYCSINWALAWAVLQVIFVMKIATKQDWVCGLFWILGIGAGTWLMLWRKKNATN